MKKILCATVLSLTLSSVWAVEIKHPDVIQKETPLTMTSSKRTNNTKFAQIIKSTMNLMGPDAQAQEEVTLKTNSDVSQSTR